MITKLEKKTIEEIITTAETIENAILALYKTADPNFDKKEKVNWARVTETTNKYICGKLIDKFNQRGGFMWMNYGFSSFDSKVDDWHAEVAE